MLGRSADKLPHIHKTPPILGLDVHRTALSSAQLIALTRLSQGCASDVVELVEGVAPACGEKMLRGEA